MICTSSPVFRGGASCGRGCGSVYRASSVGELSESDDCSLLLLPLRWATPHVGKVSASGKVNTKEDVKVVHAGVQVTTGVHKGSRSAVAAEWRGSQS